MSLLEMHKRQLAQKERQAARLATEIAALKAKIAKEEKRAR